MAERPPKILVVDDVPENVRLLEAVLVSRGYEVVTANDGRAALERVQTAEPDLSIFVADTGPGISLADREPVFEKFIEPDPQLSEAPGGTGLVLYIKRELTTGWAAASTSARGSTAERRSSSSCRQLADAVVSSGDETILRSHRRQVAMFFADLRGWSSFVDAVEPEELMRVLSEFHGVIGRLVKRFEATVGFLEGDGVQLFFNDPIEIPDAALRAVRIGCALREEMAELTPLWSKRGYDLDFGAGIALGYATCGEVGFEGRSDYAAIGAVTNLASRLADEATGGQILIAQRLYAEVENDVDVESVGEFTLKGFPRPVQAFNVLAVHEPAPELTQV